MMQPVPEHIDEGGYLSPWLLIGAILLVILVGLTLLILSSAGALTPAAVTIQAPTRVVHLTDTAVPTTVVPSPSPTTTATAVPSPTIQKYTVRKGDTLSTIAVRLKVSVEAIRAINNLKDDTIREGDVLTIPGPTPLPSPSPKPSGVVAAATPTLIAYPDTPTLSGPTVSSPTPGLTSYTVMQGDSLIAIASKLNTTVLAVMTLNQLNGPDIKAGQVLTVPIGAWTPPATAGPIVASLPTVTPTPEYLYSAPILNWPPDNREFGPGELVQLSWLSAGSLQSGEQYVVNLRFSCDGQDQAGPLVQTSGRTSFTLADKSPCPSTSRVQVTWYVVVVRAGGCPDRPPSSQPCAVSPVSDRRTFVWD